jgi:hypothetical protein
MRTFSLKTVLPAMFTALFLLVQGASAQKDTTIVEIEKDTIYQVANQEEMRTLMQEMRSYAEEAQNVLRDQIQLRDSIQAELSAGNISAEEASMAESELETQTEQSLEALERAMDRSQSSMDTLSGKTVRKKMRIVIKGSGDEEQEIEGGEELENEKDWHFDFDWEKGWKNGKKWDEERRKEDSKRTRMVIDFHGGVNLLLDDKGKLPENSARLDEWKSNVWELGFSGKTRMVGKSYVKYGLSFSWHDWTLRGKNIIDKDFLGNRQVVFLESGYNVKHSEWRSMFMNFPTMLQLDFSREGTDKGLTIGAGGYGGVRLYTLRELRYEDLNNESNWEHNYNNYFMNNWRYGLMAQLGYGSFKLTAQYDINPLFRTKNESVDGNWNNWCFTLGWTW